MYDSVCLAEVGCVEPEGVDINRLLWSHARTHSILDYIMQTLGVENEGKKMQCSIGYLKAGKLYISWPRSKGWQIQITQRKITAIVLNLYTPGSCIVLTYVIKYSWHNIYLPSLIKENRGCLSGYEFRICYIIVVVSAVVGVKVFERWVLIIEFDLMMFMSYKPWKGLHMSSWGLK